jgi:surfeit locus 1 family protein
MVTAVPNAWSRRGWVVLVATLLGMALTARLGVWQLSRAAQKEALQAALDGNGAKPELSLAELPSTDEAASARHFRQLRLQGEWVAASTVYLENRQMHGQPGFFVVTPLKLSGRDDAVLVQRGWAPRDLMDRLRVPSVPTPTGRVEVVGQLAPPPSRLYDFAGGATGPIRQNLDLAAFSRETGLALRPFSVLQADSPATTNDGLLRQWPRPAVDIYKHHGYAFQWFALCALMAGLYVWFQLIRPRLQRRV